MRVVLVGDADKVRFSIANRGKKIPAPFIQEMFAPMTRGPHVAEDGSLGLGLYITREIVQAHHGEIAVRSDDSGTVFEVDLPRAPIASPV